MKRFSDFLPIWLSAFVACAAGVAISFMWIDLPVALHFWKIGHFFHPLNTAFGASVLLSLESVIALGLILARVVRGHLSRWAEALAIACVASICTYGINSEVLKGLFGVPTPSAVMAGARHTFNFMMGSANSSFPSGHMTLAGAFAGVFMRLHRRSTWPLSALLALAACLLVVGGWHFVSDVIAGTFIGVSAGILAGEVWTVHTGATGWAG